MNKEQAYCDRCGHTIQPHDGEARYEMQAAGTAVVKGKPVGIPRWLPRRLDFHLACLAEFPTIETEESA